MALELNGKVALVTGAASGIGRATAIAFARAGANVAVCDVNEKMAAETLEAINGLDGRAIAISVDVTEPESCQDMVRRISSEFGRLDFAFNNAGITEVSVLKDDPLPPTHELPLHVWKRVLDVDLYGVFHCLQAEIPLMLEGGGGSIVNTASLQAHVSFPRTAAYTAAKHGVAGLTKCIAKEYAAANIRCNAVSPGIVNTPLTENVLTNDLYRDPLLSQIPIGRFAQGADVAAAVVWLCSEGAGYINGVTIPVDGGYLA